MDFIKSRFWDVDVDGGIFEVRARDLWLLMTTWAAHFGPLHNGGAVLLEYLAVRVVDGGMVLPLSGSWTV